MDATPRWSLPLLFAGQAQKEIFHNEALMLVDALLHGRVESADLGAPPTDPAVGQCWIVAAPAEDAWGGEVGSIACWPEGGWRFVAPRAGLRMAVGAQGQALFHDGSDWRAGAIRDDGLYQADEKVAGPRQPAIAGPAGGSVIDAQARATIAAILAALRAHGLIAS